MVNSEEVKSIYDIKLDIKGSILPHKIARVSNNQPIANNIFQIPKHENQPTIYQYQKSK